MSALRGRGSSTLPALKERWQKRRRDAPRVMKNCEPLVFGPLFAICWSGRKQHQPMREISGVPLCVVRSFGRGESHSKDSGAREAKFWALHGAEKVVSWSTVFASWKKEES